MTEDIVAFDWNGLTLVGTLHLPDADRDHPVVVMIQGSGPSDRTSNGYFPAIQDAFLMSGIGTFAFDKPGCGESTGDWRDYALEARADQVVAAVNEVRRCSRVAVDQVGIWGQSQGGWLVQMLASRLDDLPFAIANSGPSINLPAQDLYGCEHSMRAEGYSETDIELALKFVTGVHDAARERLSYEAVEARLLASARSQSWYGYFTIDNEDEWRLTSRFVNEEYEPIEALRNIECPFLAVYGGRDVLLPPWQSAQESGEALRRSRNPDTAIVVFPEGDHRIQHGPDQFVSGYFDLIVGWTARHVA